ncbi:hypothetical protein SESBI_26549 [Sesbania bispinosa]|nr:hypothetical protein SESBI_26549 [Sesbania bispinosa]
MANAALNILRLSKNTAEDEDVEVDIDFTTNTDGASGSALGRESGCFKEASPVEVIPVIRTMLVLRLT